MDTKNKVKEFLERPDRYKRALILDDSWGTGKSKLIKDILGGKIFDFTINSESQYYLIMDICDIKVNDNLLQSMYYFSKKINSEDPPIIDIEKTRFEEIKDKVKTKCNQLKSIITNNSDHMHNYAKLSENNVITKSIYQVVKETHNIFINSKNFNKYILVIDEIERCKDIKTMEWLFLKLSKLQENKNIRIIMIMNSEKLTDDIKNLFEEWMDKLVSIKISINNDELINKLMLEINPDSTVKIKNIRNIRIIENYKNIESIINEKLEKELKNRNYMKNEMMVKEIEKLKAIVYNLMLKLYDKNKNENENENENSNIPKIEEKELINETKKQIAAEDILNMEYDILYERIIFIIENFNKENYNILNSMDLFYKNRVCNIEFYKNNKNIERIKNEIFKEINSFLCKKESGLIIKLKSPAYSIFSFDKNSLLSYVDFMNLNFKLNSKDKKFLYKLIIIFLGLEKKSFKECDISEKFRIWSTYTSKTYSDKKNIYESIFDNKIYLSEYQKKGILKKINKNISYFYSQLIMLPVNQEDFHNITQIAMFNARYNKDVISLIFKEACPERDPSHLKAYIRDYFGNKVSLTNKQTLENQNILENLFRLHNLNDEKRVFYDKNKFLMMKPFEKKYKIKRNKKVFVDLYD